MDWDSDFKIKKIKIKIGKIVLREIKKIISTNLRDNLWKIAVEEDISSRITQSIENAFNNKEIEWVRFSVRKKVFNKYVNEPIVWADIWWSVSIVVRGKSIIHKWFLLQAKLAKIKDKNLSLWIYWKNRDKVVEQAEKMITFSQNGASFLFYTEDGFFVSWANTVKEYLKEDQDIPLELCSRIEEFYWRLFECTEWQKDQTFEEINEFWNRKDSEIWSTTEITAEYLNK